MPCWIPRPKPQEVGLLREARGWIRAMGRVDSAVWLLIAWLARFLTRVPSNRRPLPFPMNGSGQRSLKPNTNQLEPHELTFCQDYRMNGMNRIRGEQGEAVLRERSWPSAETIRTSSCNPEQKNSGYVSPKSAPPAERRQPDAAATKPLTATAR